MDEGKYDEAIAAFEELNGYSDSTVKIEEVKNEESYQKAIDLFSVCNYDEAITAFESLNGYKDSKDMIESIKSIQSDIYNTAKRLFISKKYTDALKEFNRVKEYKNSTYYIEYCEVYERFNGKWTWEDLSIDTYSNVYRSHYNPYQTYYIDVESKTITLDFQSPLMSFKKTNNFEIISSDSIRCDSFQEDNDDSLYWYYTKNGIMVSSSSSMY